MNYVKMFTTLKWLLLATCGVATALNLEGYNCDNPEHIRVFSGRDVEQCRNFDLELKTEIKIGQILQQRAGKPVEVMRCRVVEDVTLANCGHAGHVEGIYPDFPSAMVPLTATECREAFKTREYIYRGKKIALVLNSTVEQVVYISGAIGDNGDTCVSGGYFSYNGYAAYDAVVPSHVSVTVGTLSGVVDTSTDKLIVANSFQCNYQDGYCADDQYGTLTWDVSREPCTPTQFDELYSGAMTWFNSSSARGIVIEDKTRVAVIRPKDVVQLCGLTLTSTTIDDVFISDVQYSLPSSGGNADLFAYFETKLDYIYYKTQELDRFNLKWIAKSLCEMEQETMRLKLRTVTEAPPGNLITIDEPGVVYVASGEAVYEIQCRRVTGISLRETTACYRDLPVYVPSTSYQPASKHESPVHARGEPLELFLTPISRILVSDSAESVCSKIAPFAMELEHHWLTLNPSRAAMVQPAPFPLTFTKPDPKPYIPLLPENSIYTAEEVAELSRSMRLPRVREAVLTNIVRRMDGLSTVDKYDITKGISEEGLENLAASYADKIYGAFSSFGTFCAGIFGIWIIYRILYSIATTLFNCAAIYRVTGLSCKLLGAFFTSLTSYLVTTTKPNTKREDDPEGGGNAPRARHLLSLAGTSEQRKNLARSGNKEASEFETIPSAPANPPNQNVGVNTDQRADEFELEVLPRSEIYPKLPRETEEMFPPGARTDLYN